MRLSVTSNVVPSDSADDRRDIHLRDAELFGDLFLAVHFCLVDFSYLKHLLFGELRLAGQFSSKQGIRAAWAGTKPNHAASFGIHIAHVVGLSSLNQVFRIEACRVIAFVKNLQVAIDSSMRQLKGKAMRSPSAFFILNSAVPIWASHKRPFQADIRVSMFSNHVGHCHELTIFGAPC